MVASKTITRCEISHLADIAFTTCKTSRSNLLTQRLFCNCSRLQRIFFVFRLCSGRGGSEPVITNSFIFTATYKYRTGRNYCFQTLIFLKVSVPVNNATYLGQFWVVIHHKRGDPFTLICDMFNIYVICSIYTFWADDVLRVKKS